MKKLLTAPWMNAVVGVVVYAASTFLFWKTPVLPPPPKSEEKIAVLGASWEFSNPEADQLIAQLREEQKAMEGRQQKLDEWEKSLDARRIELNQVTQQVWQLQSDFDHAVIRINEEETPNLKKLAKVYADMTPESAAKVMAELDDAVIVKIMLFMKESETAAILETIAKESPAQAKRAAQISEHVRLSISHTTASK